MDKLNPCQCRDPFHYLDLNREKLGNPRATCLCDTIVAAGKNRRRKLGKVTSLLRSKQRRKGPVTRLVGSRKKKEKVDKKEIVGGKVQEYKRERVVQQPHFDGRLNELDHKHKPPDKPAQKTAKELKQKNIKDYFG